MTLYEDNEKDDRRERFKRKNGRARANLEDSIPRPRREPYKRKQGTADHDHWQEEFEDKWFEDDN